MTYSLEKFMSHSAVEKQLTCTGVIVVNGLAFVQVKNKNKCAQNVIKSLIDMT